MLKQKITNFLKVPAPVHWLAIALGVCGALIWLGYVAHILWTAHLGIPPRDEQLDIALVALSLFVIGWAVPLSFLHLGKHVHSRITTRN